MKKTLLFLLSTLCPAIQAHVLIFTYAYNRPDFIEIQDKTLKKFLLDEYKFVVFNDAKVTTLENQIEETCVNLGIECIRIPQIIHSLPYLPRSKGEDKNCATVRNVNVVQYSLNSMGFQHDDIVMLLDSDLFLVKPFSAREFLNEYSLGGASTGNGHVTFLWHALALLDMRSIPNKETLTFNCGRIDRNPADGGGHSYFYIKNNPDAKVRFMNHHYAGNLFCDTCKISKAPLCFHNKEKLAQAGFDKNQIRFIQNATNVEFFHNNSFLHYRAGSNWNNKDAKYHKIKTEALNAYLKTILE